MQHGSPELKSQLKSSAFPDLSEDLSELPAIPGGWQVREFEIGERRLLLSCPADPDLFLDDQAVVKANERNDYMPYWAFLWPTSIRMSQLVSHAPWPVGSQILEIGAGIGLVGLAACARGDRVTYSDYDPTALHMCRVNSLRNGLGDPDTLLLDWREPVEQQFDVIVGCEVTYDRAMHAVVLNLLKKMLRKDGVCWLGDPGRYQSPFFYQAALDEGYQIRVLNRDLKEITEPASEGFQVFEIRKRD